MSGQARRIRWVRQLDKLACEAYGTWKILERLKVDAIEDAGLSSDELKGLGMLRMSPILQAVAEERLGEMRSHESAQAAVSAQRHFKLARKQQNIHNPWREVERYALDLLLGIWLNEQAESG